KQHFSISDAVLTNPLVKRPQNPVDDAETLLRGQLEVEPRRSDRLRLRPKRSEKPQQVVYGLEAGTAAGAETESQKVFQRAVVVELQITVAGIHKDMQILHQANDLATQGRGFNIDLPKPVLL